MKTRFILSALVCMSALMIFSQYVFAEDEKVEEVEVAKKAKKVKAPMEDLSHTGVIEEKKNKKRNTFYLKTSVGKIFLPRASKKSKSPIVLANFVGKKVVVTGKGYIKVKQTKKGESKRVMYKKLLSIEEVNNGEVENTVDEK